MASLCSSLFYLPCTNSTQQSKAIFGLGPAITKDDAIINDCRLPTNDLELRCLMYNTTTPDENTNENHSKWSAAKIVYDQLMIFYQKTNIPVISHQKV